MFYKRVRLAAVWLILIASSAAADPIEGIWRRGGLRWEVKRDGVMLSVKVTAIGGNTYSYSAAPDGKIYPIHGFLPGATVRLLSADTRGFETVISLREREISHTKNVVTPDGKLLNSETFSGGSSSRSIFAHY